MSATPKSLFGMLTSFQTPANLLQVPYSGIRFWDVGVTWADMAPSRGVFDWTTLDKLLTIAKAAGKEVLLTFGKVPEWAGGTAKNNYPPFDLSTGNTSFKTFVAEVVLHSILNAPMRIAAYELWNEPNLPMYWAGTPLQLLQMLTDAHDLIKLLDPNAIVVGPAGSGGSAVDTFILSYYTAAGKAVPQDVFNYHAYVEDDSRNAMGLQTLLQNILYKMSSGQIPKQPIWFTEGSWGENSDYEEPLTNDERVAYMAVQFILMWIAGVARYYWYSWDNPKWGTMWDIETGVHPVGTAYGLLHDWLVGSVLNGQLAQNSSGTCSIPLTLANGDAAMIIWNPTAIHQYSTAFKSYRTLDNPNVNPVKAGVAYAQAKPILLFT